MYPRTAIRDNLPRLRRPDQEKVLAYLNKLIDLTTGPAECQCCGARIPDVAGWPVCTGRVDFGHTGWPRGVVPCANEGDYWYPI